MSGWEQVIDAHERLVEVRSKYDAALSAIVATQNIGGLSALEILSREVGRLDRVFFDRLNAVEVNVDRNNAGSAPQPSRHRVA